VIQNLEDLFQGAWDGLYPVVSTAWSVATADPLSVLSVLVLLAGLIWAVQACRI
jgi:hypothetical protein